MRRYFITLILLVLGTLMGQAQYSVLNGDLDHDGRITQKDVEVMADIILEKASVETIKSTSAMSYDVVRPDDCAELLDGSSFNTAIKKVANPSQQYFVDTTIRKITFRKDSSDEGTIVSSPSSPRVARALYNASAREVVVYVGADYLAFPESCARMFEYLQSLTEIDWSAFGANIFTHNVKSMNSMFSGCSALTKLDVSHFDTSKVTNMGEMFSYCSALTKLDVSHFDTRKVTNMGEMFSGCSKLSSLNLGSTFAPQGTMTSILLNTPDPAGSTKCTITCSPAAKTALCLDEGTNESKIIWNLLVEAPAKSTTLMGGKDFNVAIKKLVNPSAEAGEIDTTIRKITFRKDGSTIGTVVSSNESLGTARAVYNAETKEVVIYVNADKLIFPSDCTDMFSCFTALKQIDWSAFGTNIDTSNVTEMNGMFFNCSALTTLDVSHFDTRNVTNMTVMFSGCSALTTLDVTNFDTRSAEFMDYMFDGCSALTALDVSHFSTVNVMSLNVMFSGCSKLSSLNLGSGFTIHGTCDEILLNTPDPAGSTKCTITCTAAAKTDLCNRSFINESMIIWNIVASDSVTLKDGGLFNDDLRKLVGSPDSYDDDITIRKITFRKGYSDEGTIVSSKISQGTARAVYDAETHEVVIYANAEKLIFPSESQAMFYRLTSLEQIDWSAFGTNIDTGNVTDMSSMFDGCSALTTLDVTHFDTHNVTDMSFMFSGCSALTTLDVTHFDTHNVTDMSSMFSGCSALTTLDVTHFDTGNVTDMHRMFSDCSALTALDVTHFSTGNVTTMAYMFSDCSALTALDVTHFSTGNVTTMVYMFSACEALAALDVSNFFTHNVTDMESMFYDCPKLLSLNLGINFTIANDCSVRSMLSGTPNSTGSKKCTITCTAATQNTLRYLGSDIIESKINWNILGGASTEGEGEGEGEGAVEGESVTLLSGQSFNTAIKQLVNPSATLWDEDTTIRKITFIIGKSDEGTLVSSSASLGTARAIYDAETQQVVIYADGEKLIFPSNCQYMFADLKALEQIDWSAFGTNIDTGNVTEMSSMFSVCSALTTLDLTSFNTSKVTKMADMFNGCSALTTLDLTSFDTSKVTTMANMFQRCSALTALDLTSFNTSMVTTMGNMFSGCSQLSSLDLGSGFVIDMSCNIAYILNGTPDPAGTTQCTITCTKTTWYRLRESGTGIDQSKIEWIEC